MVAVGSIYFSVITKQKMPRTEVEEKGGYTCKMDNNISLSKSHTFIFGFSRSAFSLQKLSFTKLWLLMAVTDMCL